MNNFEAFFVFKTSIFSVVSPRPAQTRYTHNERRMRSALRATRGVFVCVLCACLLRVCLLRSCQSRACPVPVLYSLVLYFVVLSLFVLWLFLTCLSLLFILTCLSLLVCPHLFVLTCLSSLYSCFTLVRSVLACFSVTYFAFALHPFASYLSCVWLVGLVMSG